MNTPWKVILAFIGVFIAGSVFGGFFSLRIGQQVTQRERPRAAVAQPLPPQPGVPPATQLLRRFAAQLDLTEAQREKLRPIVDRAEEQIGRIRQTTLDQTDALIRQVQQDFRAELSTEQRRKLDRMQERQANAIRQERMKRQQQPGPGMGPNQPGGQFNPGQRPNQGNFIPPGPSQPGPNQPRRPFQPQRPQNPPPQDYGPPQGPPPPGPERPAGEPPPAP